MIAIIPSIVKYFALSIANLQTPGGLRSFHNECNAKRLHEVQEHEEAEGYEAS